MIGYGGISTHVVERSRKLMLDRFWPERHFIPSRVGPVNYSVWWPPEPAKPQPEQLDGKMVRRAVIKHGVLYLDVEGVGIVAVDDVGGYEREGIGLEWASLEDMG